MNDKLFVYKWWSFISTDFFISKKKWLISRVWLALRKLAGSVSREQPPQATPMLPWHQPSSHATIKFAWVSLTPFVPQDWRYCLCLTLPWRGGVRRDPKVFIKQRPRTESNCTGVSTCYQTNQLSYQPDEFQRIIRLWRIKLYDYEDSTGQKILEQSRQKQISFRRPVYQSPTSRYVKKCFPLNSMIEGFYRSFEVSIMVICFDHLSNSSYGGVL
jgi:hypothetical protein